MRNEFFAAGEGQGGERLDSFLASASGVTRSYIARLIKEGRVFLDGAPVKASLKTEEGREYEVVFPDLEPLEAIPQDIPLDILYEDSSILVINKPQGMVVHPAAGNPDGTVVNAVLFHCGDLAGINGSLRPGIVHRLDKDTSGAMVVAKNEKAQLSLTEQLKEHSARRVYLAICRGVPKQPEGRIDLPIGRHRTDRKRMAVGGSGAREAVTNYRLLEAYRGASLLRCELETGRTHQIRVHMSYTGYPVLDDPVYGTKKDDGGMQYLHALRLMLKHPDTGEEMSFFAPPPERFTERLGRLRREAGYTDEFDFCGV